MSTKGLSNPRTTTVVLDLLRDLDWEHARVADVGAGRGHFCAVVGEKLRARGIDARGRLLPCDRYPDTFQYEPLECARVAEDGRLPFEDGSCDAVVSIEVIEHVEDPFAFVRELARIARPGAHVIVTTPNVLSLSSRVRTLLWGFPELFDPLPLRDADERFMSGHIHPISPYFLAFTALRAGLESPTLHGDRRKRSSLAWMVPLGPLLLGAGAFQRGRLRRKHPEVLEQNRALLRGVGSLDLMTSRTAVLSARKPGGAT